MHTVIVFLSVCVVFEATAQTTCIEGFNSTEAARILKMHNDYRSLIAKGNFTTGTKTDPQQLVQMPAATNMQKLEWDCDLAKSAHQYVQSCTYAYENSHDFGDNVYGSRLYPENENYQITAPLKWWDQFANNTWPTPGNVTFTNATKATHRTATQMIWAKTFKVGCAVKRCSGSVFTIVQCKYNVKGNVLGEKVYETGAVCSACPELTKCELASGLCVPIQSTSTTSTTPSTTSTTPTSTTPTTTSTIPVPKTTCPDGFNSSQAIRILKMHNDYRSSIAFGNVTSGTKTDSQVEKMPAASNMYKLEWSCELAASAQAYVHSCTYAYENSPDFGDNVYGSKLYPENENYQVSAPLKWWDQFASNVWPTPGNVTFTNATKTTHRAATQMVWANTYEVGCAVKQCSGPVLSIVQCKYAVKGNVIGGEVYSIGKACAACPDDSTCETESGLCVRT